jgi:hypothetical protein
MKQKKYYILFNSLLETGTLVILLLTCWYLFFLSHLRIWYISRPAFNGGRAFDDTVDLSKALSQHYNPALALKKLKECHGWLNSKNPPFTDEELEVKGWSRGYNLTVWEEFPGESITAGKVLLQAATRGRAGITGTGPTVESTKEASSLRSSFIRKVSV